MKNNGYRLVNILHKEDKNPVDDKLLLRHLYKSAIVFSSSRSIAFLNKDGYWTIMKDKVKTDEFTIDGFRIVTTTDLIYVLEEVCD